MSSALVRERSEKRKTQALAQLKLNAHSSLCSVADVAYLAAFQAWAEDSGNEASLHKRSA